MLYAEAAACSSECLSTQQRLQAGCSNSSGTLHAAVAALTSTRPHPGATRSSGGRQWRPCGAQPPEHQSGLQQRPPLPCWSGSGADCSAQMGQACELASATWETYMAWYICLPARSISRCKSKVGLFGTCKPEVRHQLTGFHHDIIQHQLQGCHTTSLRQVLVDVVDWEHRQASGLQRSPSCSCMPRSGCSACVHWPEQPPLLPAEPPLQRRPDCSQSAS